LKKDYHFTFLELEKAIKDIKINTGDSIFLSTNIGSVGIPKSNNKNLLLASSRWLYTALQKKIGEKGNIFVPTYSYSFAKKIKVYDPKNTKSDIGYFPNFFLKQANIIRSIDPMISISGIGPDAKKILTKIPNNSYGNDSVFERFLALKNLKCLHFGLGYNWVPFVHYLDWKNNVPFRFEKFFSGKIKLNKKKIDYNWNYYARELRKETVSNGYKIGKMAKLKKLYKNTELGRSMLYVISYNEFYNFSKKMTKKNKWLTVNGPKYKS